MKKILFYIITFAAASCAVSSCYKQDDVYREFIKIGGYVYPAKPINLVSTAGYQRVVLEWELPTDPAVKTAKVFWDNYTQSVEVNYADYPEGKVILEVNKLEDRSYTFDVVNYDSSGNNSLATELTVSAYGDSWLVTHSERALVSAELEGTTAHVVLTRSTDEMVATKFRYKNTAGQVIEYGRYMQPSETEFDLPDALKGKKFEFKSGYCPENGLDTVWSSSWVKSAKGFLYSLDTDKWEIGVTKEQVNGDFTPDKIFDGIVDQPANRWHSSTSTAIRKNFPKVLVFDTHSAKGHEPTLCGYKFWIHPESQSYRYVRNVSFYVGDAPFNPDDEKFTETYEDCFVGKVLFVRSEAKQEGSFAIQNEGRYMAVAFTDSYNTNGYIDLWEYAPMGYIEGESE